MKTSTKALGELWWHGRVRFEGSWVPAIIDPDAAHEVSQPASAATEMHPAGTYRSVYLMGGQTGQGPSGFRIARLTDIEYRGRLLAEDTPEAAKVAPPPPPPARRAPPPPPPAPRKG